MKNLIIVTGGAGFVGSNLIVVTGGAGFVGFNLIKSLLKKTNKKIISLDNYSSGNKKNHIQNNRVKYLKANTNDISKILKNVKEYIKAFLDLMNVLTLTRLEAKKFLSFV